MLSKVRYINLTVDATIKNFNKVHINIFMQTNNQFSLIYMDIKNKMINNGNNYCKINILNDGDQRPKHNEYNNLFEQLKAFVSRLYF